MLWWRALKIGNCTRCGRSLSTFWSEGANRLRVVSSLRLCKAFLTGYRRVFWTVFCNCANCHVVRSGGALMFRRLQTLKDENGNDIYVGQAIMLLHVWNNSFLSSSFWGWLIIWGFTPECFFYFLTAVRCASPYDDRVWHWCVLRSSNWANLNENDVIDMA